MTEQPRPLPLLQGLVRDFHKQLSVHAEACDTDEKLKEVLSAISTASAYLARMLQVAIVSHGHGGTVPGPEGFHVPTVSLPQMASTVLDSMPPEKSTQQRHLRHWVDLQNAASFASADALAKLYSGEDA